jgi:16S rRNA (cytosine1402-N4)-methyltransferase
MSSITHQPVMLHEVIEALRVVPGEYYVDATVGGGGHARAILAKGGKLIAIDQDPQAITEAKKLLEDAGADLICGNFNKLANHVRSVTTAAVAGILFDLGTSAYQLEGEGRGFSFMRDEPLDMRMDPNLTVTAADLVNALSEKELALLFTKYAQESYAKPIAKAISAARKIKPITSTGQLTTIIMKVKKDTGKIHPATKVFQSLRIAVNDELHNLESALAQAESLLKVDGRLAVISFHEGEDRIVKQFLSQSQSLKSQTKKPVKPDSSEISINPRARSARLRIAIKC